MSDARTDAGGEADGADSLDRRIGRALGRGLAAGIRVGCVIGPIDGLAAWYRMPESIDAVGVLGGLAASVLVYSALFAALLAFVAAAAELLGRGVDVDAGRRRGFSRLVLIGLAGGLFLELYWGTREFLFWGYSALSPERLGVAVVLAVVAFALTLLLGRLLAPATRPLARLAGPVFLAALVGGGWFLWQEHALVTHGTEGDLSERNRDLPNVLFVIVDALRTDVLGCYGSERVATPVMDELAAEGVLFEKAFVQAPFTWSSFGSFLTGKYPRRHGMLKLEAGMAWAREINTTFPLHLKTGTREDGRALAEEDFATAAFMTGAVTAGSGLLRGIDLYCEALKGHELVHRKSRWSLFSADLVLFKLWSKLTQRVDYNKAGSTARDWLAGNAEDKRFFAFLHLYSTHTPYDPEPRFREQYVDPDYDGPIEAFYATHRYAIEAGQYEPTPADVEQIKNLYYAGVTQADDVIGRVLDQLERAGVLEDTIVVVSSDHGEELGEHGVWEHNWMYQTNLSVPLLVRWPKGLPEGVRVPAIVDSIDLFPTLCELMGLELPVPPDDGHDAEYHRIDGASLVPLVRGEVDAVREFSFAESGPALSIQDLRWKLVVSRECLDYGPDDPGWTRALRTPMLFDLASDPNETDNLFDPRHPEVARLLQALREWDASLPIPREAVAASHRDLEAEELLLQDLGYAGGIGGD